MTITNCEARHFAHELDADPTTDLLEGGLPYVVYHADAHGQCERPAATRTYGLYFCEIHGEELANEGENATEHQRALVRAYPDVPESVRANVREW